MSRNQPTSSKASAAGQNSDTQNTDPYTYLKNGDELQEGDEREADGEWIECDWKVWGKMSIESGPCRRIAMTTQPRPDGSQNAEANTSDYACPSCKRGLGYFEGDSRCLRCDDIFDGSLANCTKCGSGNYETLCPHCGGVVDTQDNN